MNTLIFSNQILLKYFDSSSSIVNVSQSCNLFRSNSLKARPFLSNRKCNSNIISCSSLSTLNIDTKNYEFVDGSSDAEFRLPLVGVDAPSAQDIIVDARESSLTIKVRRAGSVTTLLQDNKLFDMIKPSETIWYIDDDELVINLKKQDADLAWPDIFETWQSLTAGATQLLKGTSIYLVGSSTEINQKVGRELAVGLGYTPLNTRDLLEDFSKKSIDSWVSNEGSDSVGEAESAILDSLSSHIRTVVATLGGNHGAAGRPDKWRHLYAGFTVWLSESKAFDETSAKEEVRRHIKDGTSAYSNADVVVKFQGWDPDQAKTLAQASLSALKQLILSDKKLPGKKGLYIRLGCRGDWPNIKPPGWDPANGAEGNPNMM